MKKVLYGVYLILCMGIFCSCMINYKADEEKYRADNLYDKHTVAEYHRTYGVDEEDFPFSEIGEDFFDSFSGVDEKLAVEIAYDVANSRWGIEEMKKNLGTENLEAYISNVLPKRESYMVSFGPKDGVGMGYYVMISKANGAVLGIYAGGE